VRHRLDPGEARPSRRLNSLSLIFDEPLDSSSFARTMRSWRRCAAPICCGKGLVAVKKCRGPVVGQAAEEQYRRALRIAEGRRPSSRNCAPP
jgi:hypothetical protein